MLQDGLQSVSTGTNRAQNRLGNSSVSRGRTAVVCKSRGSALLGQLSAGVRMLSWRETGFFLQLEGPPSTGSLPSLSANEDSEVQTGQFDFIHLAVVNWSSQNSLLAGKPC